MSPTKIQNLAYSAKGMCGGRVIIDVYNLVFIYIFALQITADGTIQIL
jgi:hypothetical protein